MAGNALKNPPFQLNSIRFSIFYEGIVFTSKCHLNVLKRFDDAKFDCKNLSILAKFIVSISQAFPNQDAHKSPGRESIQAFFLCRRLVHWEQFIEQTSISVGNFPFHCLRSALVMAKEK